MLILSRAGGGRIVVFEVKNDPNFSQHFAIYLGKNLVLDPTFRQVKGARGAVLKIEEYPPNYLAKGVFDWGEDFLSADLDLLKENTPRILKKRGEEARSDLVFYGCLAVIATLPLTTALAGGLLLN